MVGVLFDLNGIGAPQHAVADHARIDPNVHLIVQGSSAQDARVLWQVRLGQRRHHAARTAAGDPDANLIAQSHGAAPTHWFSRKETSPDVEVTTMFGRKRRTSNRPCG